MLDWVGDIELQAMSTEELDAVQEQAMREFTEAGDKLSAMLKKAEPLKQLSADEKKQLTFKLFRYTFRFFPIQSDYSS